MSSTTYKNELTKRRFYEYLRGSKGFSKETVECYEKAIWLWEGFTKNADFTNFNKTSADAFKDFLKAKKKHYSQGNVSLSYCYDVLRFLKTFFEWLSKQSGYKSKINQTAIDYLNLTRKEAREATQSKEKQCPTLEEVKTVIESIKGETEAEMRDRALISLIFLTGARIWAVMTLTMKSFDRESLVLYQDPSLGVATKFSKRIVTALIPFSYDKPMDYFLEWFDYLKKEKKFNPDDPIFPSTKIENGKENISYYNTGEVSSNFWKSSSTPRKIFEKRFEKAGVKYYHPHTLRHLWVKEISKFPLTEEQKKAISQNLGHENVGTTFGSYGYSKIDENKQLEIIRNIDLNGKNRSISVNLTLDEIKQLLKEGQGG